MGELLHPTNQRSFLTNQQKNFRDKNQLIQIEGPTLFLIKLLEGREQKMEVIQKVIIEMAEQVPIIKIQFSFLKNYVNPIGRESSNKDRTNSKNNIPYNNIYNSKLSPLYKIFLYPL